MRKILGGGPKSGKEREPEKMFTIHLTKDDYPALQKYKELKKVKIRNFV
jgi:hypothetical protein